MKTALRLREYEDILDVEDVYCLIALTSFYNKFFGQCSKAFIKLEAMEGADEKRKAAIEQLALAIFAGSGKGSGHAPVDPGTRRLECPNCSANTKDWHASCEECGHTFPACVVTGRSILDPKNQWMCRRCKHRAIDTEITNHQFCPLCHGRIDSMSKVPLGDPQ